MHCSPLWRDRLNMMVGFKQSEYDGVFQSNMTAGLRQSKYDTWFETTQKSWIVWDKVHMTYGLRQREYDA